MNKKVIFIYSVILLIAAILRFYRLDSIPPGANRDEASIGYTSYSLLQTGKDEYGRNYPLSFQSFGDWKLPLYIYITIPFVKTIGLTEIAVRLPSAIAGFLTVAMSYFLAYIIFKNTAVALLSELTLALSPWHIHMSRTESESNLAVFFVTIALLFLFRSIYKTPKALFISFIFFGLTFYTYHGSHIFTTLLVIGIFIIFLNEFKKNKYFLPSALLFFILTGFILSKTLLQSDKTKISGISIFGNPTIVYEKIEKPRLTHANPNSLPVRLVHNRITYSFQTIVQNYLKTFSPEFLIIKGGTNHAHNIPDFGNIYILDYFFLFAGLIYLLIQSKLNKQTQLLIWWLLIGPVASSITKDAPHTNRAFDIYPALSSVIAYGMYKFLGVFEIHKIIRKGLIAAISVGYIFNLLIYLDLYYVHFPQVDQQYWGEPYKKIVSFISSPDNLQKKVIFSHPEHSPYIFLLFYSSFKPAKYQREAIRYSATQDGFIHVKSFDRFEFRPIDWGKDIALGNTLLVSDKEEIPSQYLPNTRFFGFLDIVSPK